MNIKKKLNGWWKDFALNVKCYGVFTALLKETPWYYTIHNFFWEIRYRTTHRYHIVKLGKPAYYEMRTRLLFANMAIVTEYVEEFEHLVWDKGNDKVVDRWKGIKAIEAKIQSIYENWEEDKKSGWDERNEKEPMNRYDYQAEVHGLKELIRLYIWWKETFPLIEDNNPWMLNFDKMYPKDFPSAGQRVLKQLEDGTTLTIVTDCFNDEGVPEELVELRSKYIKESMEYEVGVEEEITNNLVSLMKIREKLYD